MMVWVSMEDGSIWVSMEEWEYDGMGQYGRMGV